MARIEWVKLRLNNWALWRARDMSGGSGWASQSSFLFERSGGYRESTVPVDDVDASVTNEAVEALKPDKVHLYDTLQCIYPHGMGIAATARRLCVAESTIKARLDQADQVLRLWFSDRAERKKSFPT